MFFFFSFFSFFLFFSVIFHFLQKTYFEGTVLGERRRKKKEERRTSRQKQVRFHNRTHRIFFLFACVETPHSDIASPLPATQARHSEVRSRRVCCAVLCNVLFCVFCFVRCLFCSSLFVALRRFPCVAWSLLPLPLLEYLSAFVSHSESKCLDMFRRSVPQAFQDRTTSCSLWKRSVRHVTHCGRL